MSDATTSTDAGGAPQALGRHVRRTPLSAHGEPMVWITGGGLVACLGLIVWLISLIVWQGARTFWPADIERVELASGEVFLGVPLNSERFEPSPEVAAGIRARVAAGELDADAIDDAGLAPQRRYRVGNLDLGQQSFRWVPEHEIAGIDRPADAAMLERQRWGVFLGEFEAAVVDVPAEGSSGTVGDPSVFGDDARLVGGALPGRLLERYGRGASERVTRADGLVVDRVVVGADEASRREALRAMLDDAWARRAAIDELNKGTSPRLQQRITRLGWRAQGARLEAERTESGSRRPVHPGLWAVGVLASAGCLAGSVVVGRRAARKATGSGRRSSLLLANTLRVLAAVGVLFAVFEHPWSAPSMTPERLETKLASIEAEQAGLETEQGRVLARLDAMRLVDSAYRVRFVDARTGRFAPESQSSPDAPMLLSGIVRMIKPNEMGAGDKLGVYLDRWGEFLGKGPRETPTEGGVFPVIVGTVMLTLMLTVAVVPLGVIAAIYMREYAHQGLVTSVMRIAINNLAGVPSIVYGMFGLGFFCYTLGGYIDVGPEPEAVAGRGMWWMVAVVCGAMITGALGLGLLARRDPGRPFRASQQVARAVVVLLWLGAIVGALWMISTTPYFNGAFAAKMPAEPTFGGRGILWASLTLALLTLPVVIVATEEAVAAVPRSMREGSVGCGASKWQTIRNIVLPASMPGIMTGAILAMARGAGEVAPIMLVGAVNLAPGLPVSGDFPFVHGDRSFMHLGFHIYNLGFQSQDSEATRPLVWTTTLLLIVIVLALNLSAIVIRSRVRGRHGGPGV